jgi:hypothetical protein
MAQGEEEEAAKGGVAGPLLQDPEHRLLGTELSLSLRGRMTLEVGEIF